ncbi:MAG: hypothetical protein ABGY32_13460, partial [bacterium]
MHFRFPRLLLASLLTGASLLALATAKTPSSDAPVSKTPARHLLDALGDPAPAATGNDGDAPTPVPAPIIRSRYGKLELANWPSLISSRVHRRVEWIWPVAEAMGARIDIQEEGRVVLL